MKQRGQAMIEYALLGFLVSVIIIIGLVMLGGAVKGAVGKVSTGFGSAATPATDCQQGHGQPSDNGKCTGH